MKMRKKLLVPLFILLPLLSCTARPPDTPTESSNLVLGESSYAELVDFLYSYAGQNRLTVLWFGWYQKQPVQAWYEKADKRSNFKIKLELLTEENGSIFITSHSRQGVAGMSIDYGDQKSTWLAIVADFKAELAQHGWRIEPLQSWNMDELKTVK